MATKRILLQRRVKEVRRSATGCKECGRRLPQGLMLGGPGPTFSEMVMEPKMTWDHIQEEIDSRGFMCRGCLNRSTEINFAGASSDRFRTTEELMKDPSIQKQMRKYGIPLPGEDDDEENNEVLLEGAVPVEISSSSSNSTFDRGHKWGDKIEWKDGEKNPLETFSEEIDPVVSRIVNYSNS